MALVQRQLAYMYVFGTPRTAKLISVLPRLIFPSGYEPVILRPAESFNTIFLNSRKLFSPLILHYIDSYIPRAYSQPVFAGKPWNHFRCPVALFSEIREKR